MTPEQLYALEELRVAYLAYEPRRDAQGNVYRRFTEERHMDLGLKVEAFIEAMGDKP